MKPFPFLQRINLSRFLRGFGPEPGPIELNRRRIYILPTKQGFMFGLLLLILLLGSMNYNNSLGFALTFLLASLGNLCILYTYRNLAGLTFKLGKIEPCFAGEPLSFYMLVTNNSDFDHLAVQMETADDEVLFDITARGQQSILMHSATNFRGRFPLERLTLSTRFPMGLFRAWAHLHLDNTYLVYPQPQDVRDPDPADGYGLSQQGDRGR